MKKVFKVIFDIKVVVVVLLLSIIVIVTQFGLSRKDRSLSQNGKALKVHYGKFAFCGASGAKLTGDTIEVQGKKFLEGCSICPVLEGPSIANVELMGDNFDTPDGSDTTVWSLFWYFDSVAQAPTWDVLPTVNRSFVVTDTLGGGMSNMFCMPCEILKEKVNGVTLAKCFGPINEAAVPLRRSMRVFPGETSITQAPVGAPYPVGTPIPVNRDILEK
tara:strand:- start:576 stop:1226 length:651 start_codon:yes stop_codon:yes gene_type:complete